MRSLAPPLSTRGRRTALRVTLTPAEATVLSQWVKTAETPQRQRRRALLVLLLDAGYSITATSVWCGRTRRWVYKWVARWQQAGIAGLIEAQRGPRPKGDRAC